MAELVVRLVGDSSSLERAFQKSTKDTQKFSKNVETTSKSSSHLFSALKTGAGLATGALGIEGLAGAFGDVFDKFSAGQQSAAQTAAALKSTGGVANVTAGQVDGLAKSIQNKTGIDDYAIASSENLLLAFQGVRNETGKGNDVFNRATTAVTNLATRLNHGATPSLTQMKSATTALGKALDDPIKGTSSLRRVGILFTASQTKLIKSLVSSGNTLGAQKIILNQVQKAVGGAAVASGKTLPGQLNILKQTALTLGSTILTKLMPTITHVVTAMTTWLQSSKNQKKIMDIVNGVIGTVTTAIKILKTAFDVLSKAVGGNKHAIELLVAAYATFKIAKIAGSVASLAGNFTSLGKGAEGATGSIKGMSGALGKAGLAGAALAAGYEIGQLLNKIPAVQRAEKAIGGLAYSAASSLGLVNDPMSKYAGKVTPSQGQATSLIGQARRLERGGLSAAQAAARLAAAHPNFAQSDLTVFANAAARQPAIVVNGDLHVHGVQNPRQLQDAITKAARHRPVRRRGDP